MGTFCMQKNMKEQELLSLKFKLMVNQKV